MSYRTILKTVLAGIPLTMAGGWLYSTRIEPVYGLDIQRVNVPLRHLPPELAGMTIAQLSDLHFGDWMTGARMREIVAQVNALEPDIVVITGDFFSYLYRYAINGMIDSLRELKACEGVYAVPGNHDYWTDIRMVAAAIEQTGMHLLRNEHAAIPRAGQTLYIAGLDDIWEGKHHLDAALKGIPTGAPVVLLAHEPDYADRVALDGRVGLQLSGHTHGGQVRLPGIGALKLPALGYKYDMGLYQVDDMALYVNRGVGMIAPYVRFNCPPEITLITLTCV